MNYSDSNTGMSRRKFITLAGGGAVGLAALSSMGIPMANETGWGSNDSELKTEEIGSKEHTTDVLVFKKWGLFSALYLFSLILIIKGKIRTF